MYQEKINRNFCYFKDYYKEQLLSAKKGFGWGLIYSTEILRHIAINRNLMRFKNTK